MAGPSSGQSPSRIASRVGAQCLVGVVLWGVGAAAPALKLFSKFLPEKAPKPAPIVYTLR